MMDRRERQKRGKSGFTLAELLVVVVIITILAGVSFVAAIRYQGQLKRVEMDQTAKQVFLAAQNRLSLETSRGTMAELLKDVADSESKLGEPSGTDGEYCIVYAAGAVDKNDKIRERLLPFGSIDETVRTDGSYLIFYEPGTGCIRAVWYSDEYRFVTGDIGTQALKDAAADPGIRQRFSGANSDYAGKTVTVGYYSGETVGNGGEKPKTDLKPVSLSLYNESVLYAKVHDPNMQGSSADYTVQLVIEGVQSGAKCRMELKKSDSANARTATDLAGHDYYVILDDITASGMNFDSLNSDTHVTFDGTRKLIPGEDIDVSVDVLLAGQKNPVQTTTVYRENSLFGDKKSGNVGKNGKVTVENMRHLENLDYRVSAVDPVNRGDDLGLTPVGEDCFYDAVQQRNLSWEGFCEETADIHRLASFAPAFAKTKGEISVSFHVLDETEGQKSVHTAAGSFLPVEPQFPLNYDGNLFAIDRITVTGDEDSEMSGGLFGTVIKNLSVFGLKLRCPEIQVSGLACAGALIGTGGADTRIQLKNVMIQYPSVHASGEKAMTSTAPVDAGGLIGSFSGAELSIEGVVVEDSFLTKKEKNAPEMIEPQVSKPEQLSAAVSGNHAGQNADDPDGDGAERTAAAEVGNGTDETAKAAGSGKTALEEPSDDEEKTLGIYSSSGNAGGLVGSISSGIVRVFSSAAAVYVDGGDYAGGLFGSVVTSGAVTVDSCYVGAHTSSGKLLITPLPDKKEFDGLSGRYNIVSRATRAGGLAAVMPANSKISHSYVTASLYSAQGVNLAPETSEWGNEPDADDGQKCAAFIALSGDPHATGTAEIDGKQASEYPYCYSAAIVNGARAVTYADTLKDLFEGTENAADPGKTEKAKKSENKAVPYDPVFEETAYPMPLVTDLNRKDPAVTAEQKKALYRYVRVHIGDWMVPAEKKKEEAPDTGNTQTNSMNRLYVEHEIEIPRINDTTTYLSVSVNGTLSGKTFYYVLNPIWNGTDFSGSRLTMVNEQNLNPGSVQSYGWRNMKDLTEKRMEIVPGESGKIKIRFYLDNLSVPSGGYQSLHSIDNQGNSQDLKAGEDIKVGIHEGIGIPTEEECTVMNSMFQRVEMNDDGTYTAYIANARHLENLNFFGNSGNNSNTICVTKAVQTADILWQNDQEFDKKSDQDSQAEAYGTEIQDAYGNLQIYIGTWSPVPQGTFIPIDNDSLRCYDGGSHTIAGLKIAENSYQNNRGAALFYGNSDFEIKDLNLKNPEVVSTNGNTGILVAGDSGKEAEQLTLSRIKIYGDKIKVSIGGYGSFVGGVIGSIKAKKLVLDQVEIYGKSVLVQKNGGGAVGGLAGSLDITDSMLIKNCVFSGHVVGSTDPYNTKGTGGLTGQLTVSAQKTAEITNCYVAGRNDAQLDTNTGKGPTTLIDGVNLAGGKKVGGFVGELKGALKVSNSFIAAGIYDCAGENNKAVGGFIGLANGNSKASFDNCYFAGNINRYGSTIKSGTTISRGWDQNVGILIGSAGSSEIKWKSCFYLELAGFSGKPVIGDRANLGTGEFAVSPADQSAMSHLTPSGAGDRADITEPYDQALVNQPYPYKIWTTGADGKKVYHGDWLDVSGLKD